MRTVVICINGVLRPAGRPDGVDSLGRQLYESLKQRFRVILLDDGEASATQHWLDVHGFIGHARAYTPPVNFAPRTVADGRLRLLAAVRSTDGADLVVEPDPACAADEIRAGYNVLLYSSPQYLLDIWHPDAVKEPRAWDRIVEEIEGQRAAKAADTRLKDVDD